MVELARKFSKSRSLWMEFKKVSWKRCIRKLSVAMMRTMVILMKKRGFHAMLKASHKQKRC